MQTISTILKFLAKLPSLNITKHISRAYLKDLYLIFPSEGVFIMNVDLRSNEDLSNINKLKHT